MTGNPEIKLLTKMQSTIFKDNMVVDAVTTCFAAFMTLFPH
jgi:hypothetical protein